MSEKPLHEMWRKASELVSEMPGWDGVSIHMTPTHYCGYLFDAVSGQFNHYSRQKTVANDPRWERGA